MQPRNVEDGRRRLNSPRRDQRTFRLLPQTAGVPHPARPCPLQSPKCAFVTASLWLPSGLASRRSATDSTPDALFHSSASLSAPQVQTEAKMSAHSGRLVHADDHAFTNPDSNLMQMHLNRMNILPFVTTQPRLWYLRRVGWHLISEFKKNTANVRANATSNRRLSYDERRPEHCRL
jgi:hypothetical protein